MSLDALTQHWLADLNPAQKEAVTYGDGPVLVLAGAGSGKTRVLTYRVAYLVAARKVRPWNILAVTFTNKAAREMKERVETLLGGDLGATLITFHSWCARFLRREAGRLGYPSDYTIYDDDDQIRAVKNVMGELEIDTKRFNPNAVLASISHAKNRLVGPDQFDSQPNDYFSQQVSRVYAAYEDRLRRCGAMDFDDLLFNSVRLLRRDGEVREAVRSRITHLLVDEYQDTNHAQYTLLRLLVPDTNNVMVVGDDDQSIYGWRGADIRNILDFERDFPGAHIVALEQNYRSTQTILDLASAVVKHNTGHKRKKLWTERSGGDAVRLGVHDDDRAESMWISSRIEQMVKGDGKAYGEFAILYRTNAQSRVFEETLRSMRIPYAVVGGVRFYQRREIKDLVAYLRVLVNPADDLSLLRILNVPRRGIGQSSEDRLNALAMSKRIPVRQALAIANEAITGAPGKRLVDFGHLLDRFSALMQELSPPELVQRIATETGMFEELAAEDAQDGKGRADNVKEFIAGVAEFSEEQPDARLTDYLEQVALLTDVDRYDEQPDRVTMMTLHSAKGLEYPVVFLSGLEEGLFPMSRSLDSPEDIEEERRLFYVGITRARERLLLSWAHRRRRFGEMVNLRSRFLDEIPEGLFEEEDFGYRTSHFYHRPTMVRPSGYSGPARPTGYMAPAEPSTPPRPARSTYMEEPIPPADPTGELAVGSRVRHPQFGEGRVVRMLGGGEHLQLEVIFQNQFKKKLLAKYAKLQLL